MKKNLKNKIKKMVAGMMLVCSLLTLFGGVSSDGIAMCVDIVEGVITKG
jgi:hypothetical protein